MKKFKKIKNKNLPFLGNYNLKGDKKEKRLFLGFSLVEILVAVTIFSLLLSAASGIFISTLKAQKYNLGTQQLLNQTSYAMEYMSRAIRMAKKDIDGNCTGGANLNYSKTDSKIMFENYDGNCQEFSREWDDAAGVYRLKETKEGSANYLTSSDLDLLSFNIGPDDSWDQNDDLQPRITIFLEIKGKGPKPEQEPGIKIQTTVSQRNLDVQY
jgi:prepilin-type N-terminal cleavage/methylation domain-containing protein